MQCIDKQGGPTGSTLLFNMFKRLLKQISRRKKQTTFVVIDALRINSINIVSEQANGTVSVNITFLYDFK